MRETSSGTGSVRKALRKGFVDLQVNGYLGIDFSSPALTREDIHNITTALVRSGTIAYCATLITADLPIYERNFPLLARTMEEPGVKGHLLGIHLEGPYLSPFDGARGAHLPQWIRKPDPEEFRRLQDWADGRIVILTLAPEVAGALELISFVKKHYQTRIALGHHLASSEILRRAADSGASLITHLGNGCPNVLPRHENILIHQLINDSLTAGIITDGNHIPPEFIQVVLRCKDVDRVFVVSDSAPIAGFEPGIYETLGNEVRLTETGRIESLRAPHLVGSGYNIAQCMRYLRSLGFLKEDELWQVGLDNPLEILGVSLDSSTLDSLPDFNF
jgi:N-acetylglucosamine-6-phosphate deacetylase